MRPGKALKSSISVAVDSKAIETMDAELLLRMGSTSARVTVAVKVRSLTVARRAWMSNETDVCPSKVPKSALISLLAMVKEPDPEVMVALT